MPGIIRLVHKGKSHSAANSALTASLQGSTETDTSFGRMGPGPSHPRRATASAAVSTVPRGTGYAAVGTAPALGTIYLNFT